MSSLTNEGMMGIGNSMNCSTKATAVSIAATAMWWVFFLWLAAEVSTCSPAGAVTTFFMILVSFFEQK